MITAKYDTDKIKVFFLYSPAAELISSLSVISNPSHHPATKEWAIRAFDSLSDKLQKEITFFSSHYADWLFVADAVLSILEDAYPKKLSVEETLELMMKMDNRSFAELFLGLTAFDYSNDLLDKWMNNPESLTVEELGVQAHFLDTEDVKAFLRDIDGFKKRIRWALLQYWEECFKDEWPAIESYFDTVIRKEELNLNNTSCIEYVQTLHPDLSVENGTIIFHKNPDYYVPINKINKLVFILSVFSTPHLCGNYFDGTLDITRNLNYHSVMLQENLSDDIFSIITASSDMSRLKIIKILWNGDSTTKELSEILNLSPSTVSLHLKILKDANLVETNKIKKYVYYKLKKDVFYKLQQGLVDYFQY